MFKKLTKFIVNQMDSCTELIPVESIADNEHFRPLCILKKKRKSKNLFNRVFYYQWTGFTLHDVLLPGEDVESIDPLIQDCSPFTLIKISVDEADGGLSISHDPASADLQGGACLSNVISVKPQKKSISLESLEALRRERQIDMDHSFIQQLWKRDITLYMVTEILEASEETVYKESIKADGGLKAKFYATFRGKGKRENNQGIVIPKGCTLAFRTTPLQIRGGAWNLDYFSAEAKKSAAGVADDPSQGKLVTARNVEYPRGNYSELPLDLMLIMLNFWRAAIRDNNLLQEPRQKKTRAATAT